MTTPTHLTPAELDALLEAAKAMTAELNPATLTRFRDVCHPATITRLVLMVRELQRDNEKWQRAAGHWKAQHESEENSHRLTTAVFRRQEEIWQQKNLEADTAVEHFRARAVRAIQQLYEVPTPHNIDISLGYAEGLERATKLIESLPLVETEK